MQNLFSLSSPAGQGIMKFPEWNYVALGLKKNLSTVINFYRHNPMAVKSDHFLVKLLQTITIPQSQCLERYYSNVDAISLNVSMVLKMTSSIYKGQMFEGIFYGLGSPEILIANSDSFDFEKAHVQWKNCCPVKVLRHSISDLNLNIPNGHVNGSEAGLAVISINITMLAVMYRAFRMNQMLIADGDSEESVMQFIHMYVLPNMLFSHLDHVLFNRIDNLLQGAPMGESRVKHSFFLIDYSEKVTHIQTGLIRNIEKVGKDFIGILRSIPAITKNNMDELMAMPEIAPTRQIVWALVIARLEVLTFLFMISEDGPGKRNQMQVNRILRNITAYRSDNLMRSMLPIDIYMDVEDDINKLIVESK